MQYVRSISGSVSKTWNSINPATLSGAIDVIVVEQEDGSLACSPFHVRFGKFSLLRPSQKKVEFVVNNVKQDFQMKLGEGGEAFFVFETSSDVPAALRTSPLSSPAASPETRPAGFASDTSLLEPDALDLAVDEHRPGTLRAKPRPQPSPLTSANRRAQSDTGKVTPLSRSPQFLAKGSGPQHDLPHAKAPPLDRSKSEDSISFPARGSEATCVGNNTNGLRESSRTFAQPDRASSDRSASPPPLSHQEAVSRAITLSKKLWVSNIPSKVTDSGDLMLDITGYKSSDDDALRAEVIARKILSEELEGNYDIGALIGADEKGNLWIYSSEEAKEAAAQRAEMNSFAPQAMASTDALSDPGYHSDDGRSVESSDYVGKHVRRDSDSAVGLSTPPKTPDADSASGDPNRNYAKTLRLTSDQLKTLNLKPGQNTMSFTVNRATCQASMFYWKYDVPIVISDIDGTITKSDALGHVLNMIGRDWTHLGVAKLYTDIVANGYNIFYLTSRSTGQADSTRAYLNGVVQDGYKLPKGPVIMSPDRTIAALRREIYLRKPEVFKMACLRDIRSLFQNKNNPFYAGFGNRLTDALSYRSVNIPSTRIFTINSNAEVSMDLLTLNKHKTSYNSMQEIVDHFFPPVSLLVKGEGENFTDFNYWRESPLDVDDFSASESDEEDEIARRLSVKSEDERSEGDDEADDLEDSYLSRESTVRPAGLEASIVESVEEDDALWPETEVKRADVRVAKADINEEELEALDLAAYNDPGGKSKGVPEDVKELAHILNTPERVSKAAFRDHRQPTW